MEVTIFLFVIVISLSQSLPQSANESLHLCDSAGDVDYEKYTSNVTQNCGCENRTECVRKCCQKGFQLYYEGDSDEELSITECIRNKQDTFNVSIYNDTKWVRNEANNFLIGTLNCNASTPYRKVNSSDPQHNFYIQEDGSLYYLYDKKVYGIESYCLDDQDGLTAYLCFIPNPQENGHPENHIYIATLIHMIAKFISLPFLAITGIVYALLPERNLHRNALMNHVFSLIPGSALIALGQHVVIQDDFLCYCQGYLALFFMVASFFWMNVICIDISLAFSGLRGQVQERARLMLIIASLYAWGLPGLNVLIVIILNHYGDQTTSYYPGVGIESCFLKNELPAIIYYFMPVLILILINLGLFVMTVVNIRKAQKETKMVQNSQNKKRANTDDYRFRLYWKLLFVMGLNPVVNTHVIQIISWFLGKQITRDIALYIWFYKDFSHACYGLVIFLIFVCQKRIWVAVQGRFNWIWKIKKNDSKASATSSLASSSENGVSGIRLREIQNKEDIP